MSFAGKAPPTSSSSSSSSSSTSRRKRHEDPQPIFLKKIGAGKTEVQVLDAPNSTMKFETRRPKGPFVMTGPVIGLVTDVTARIVVEINVDSLITCIVTDRSGHSFAVQRSFKARTPAAFYIEGLRPQTQYKVTFNVPVPGLVKSSFKTLPSNLSCKKHKPNFGFVSCNKYRITRDSVPDKFDLWKDLYKKVSRGDVDYLIHMGDNVYADSDLYDIEEGTLHDTKDCRWHVALTRLEGVPQSKWEDYYEEICEICRSIYRETWNHPPTKHTLANIPNLMILDDHDIRDDWGDRPSDSDPTSKEFFIACCFYEVYNQYQRNLFEDYIPGKKALDSCKVGQTYHFHVFGDVGIMITDARGCKTFHRDYNNLQREKEVPLLGLQQWADIESSLGKGGYFSRCRMLFAVCPQPPCYIGEGPNMFVAKLSRFFDDLYGSWTASAHVPEASMFLQALFDWRGCKPGFREVCIVAGDVHEGGNTDIIDLRYAALHDRRLDRMKQITTSAIANTVTKMHEHYALHLARTMINSVGKWHQFTHYSWTGMRNFNIISVYCERDPKSEKKYGFRGVATRFSSQMFGANSKTKKQFKPVTSDHRTLAMAGGWATLWGGLGFCGGGQCGAQYYEDCLGHEGAPNSLPIQ